MNDYETPAGFELEGEGNGNEIRTFVSQLATYCETLDSSDRYQLEVTLTKKDN